MTNDEYKTLTERGALQRDEQGRWLRRPVESFCSSLPVARMVLISDEAIDVDSLRKLSEIKYPNGKHGEGIVVRALDQQWSFKVLNLNYKESA